MFTVVGYKSTRVQESYNGASQSGYTAWASDFLAVIVVVVGVARCIASTTISLFCHDRVIPYFMYFYLITSPGDKGYKKKFEH